MKQNKKPSILYWGKELINLSIFSEKIDPKKPVVKHLKKKQTPIMALFHPNMVLWYLMFSHIEKSIDIVDKLAHTFVFDENKFTRKSKFSFKDYITFICFNKGLSNQADIEDFVEDDFTNELEIITG